MTGNIGNLAFLGYGPGMDPADVLDEALRIGQGDAAVIYCASGIRSAQAVHALRGRGYEHVVSLRGGINAWLEQHDLS